MKCYVLQLNFILVLVINDKLESFYYMYCLFEQEDKEVYFDCYGVVIEGVIIGGYIGISNVFMDCLLVLKVVVVNGVGIDVVDFNYVCSKGLLVIGIFGVLIEDVVDLVLGLMLVVSWQICLGYVFVQCGDWVCYFLLMVILLLCCLSGKCVGIVGMGKVGCVIVQCVVVFGCLIVYIDLCVMEDLFYIFQVELL